MASNNELVARGETPIRITWDYNALAAIDAFADNPSAEMIIPKTGQLAGLNVQAISAYAPHPESAKLWVEFLYSDEGQLLRMKGYCHPIRKTDLRTRDIVLADLAAKLPDTSAAIFGISRSVQLCQGLGCQELDRRCRCGNLTCSMTALE